MASVGYKYVYHCTSLINMASLISTPVQYYLNTNIIDIVYSNFYQQYTLKQYYMELRNSSYYGKLLYKDDNFINRIRVVTRKQRGNIGGSILNMYIANTHTYKIQPQIAIYSIMYSWHRDYRVTLSLAVNNSVLLWIHQPDYRRVKS